MIGMVKMKTTVNNRQSEKRERVYLYVTKEDKQWLKEKAIQNGISLSKYIHDLLQAEIDKDIRLDLK